MQTCQVFNCKEDNFVPSFAFTDVIHNEIEFHEQVFPQSDNNEIQNDLDSESGMLLDYENDILIESGGNIEIVRQNITIDTLNNKFQTFNLKQPNLMTNLVKRIHLQKIIYLLKLIYLLKIIHL